MRIAGSRKVKNILNALLLMTMYGCASVNTTIPTSAQEAEKSDAEELFYRGRTIPKVESSRGYIDPPTGKWVNRPVSTSVDSTSKPNNTPVMQTVVGTPTSVSTGLHCMIELRDPRGGAPVFKDLSISRDFRTGDVIQIYCRSNIDARLVIWQQQNGEETLIYPYDNIDNRLSIDHFAPIQPQNHAMQFQKGEEGEFTLKFLIITDERYKEIQSSPTGNPQQRLTAAYREASRGVAPIVTCNEASRGLAPVVSCNPNGFFAATKDPVLALEIVLNQLP